MSERTKKLHTDANIEVVIHGDDSAMRYMLPRSSVQKLMIQLKQFKVVEAGDEEMVSPEEVFKDIYAKYGVIGATIRGFRLRDEMTQAMLAVKLEVRQSHISEMEHSKRPVGKKLAQKLAKIFRTNYRLFL